ncbi:MAG: tripartite tricarboxylate transporter TctB family protein [Pseudomonadota bacterium]
MEERRTQIGIGLAAVSVAAFLILFGIPGWVSAPSNVGNIVLSPLFWPYCLAGFTGLAGLGVLANGLRRPAVAMGGQTGDGAGGVEPVPGGLVRLALMVGIMALTMFALPRLGMVWTAMLAFIAVAFLVKTRHPRTAIACGIAVPLVLYAFFAHVAGVAIPQGNFVRLP